MTWRVLWTPRALKDIRKLDEPTRERVAAAIKRYAVTGVGDAAD